jgi:hypothetical protein
LPNVRKEKGPIKALLCADSLIIATR